MTIDICNVTLKTGSHASPDKGACVMEAVSMFKGEPWSDHPACVCPVIASACRVANDWWWPSDTERTAMLLPLAARHGADGECVDGPIIGTRSTPDVGQKRGFMAADWAVRVAAPMALRHSKCPDLAERLEGLGEIVDETSAKAARDVAREVRATASAATASAATASAAYAADAADAAADAAYAAAADDAAYAAAHAAADAAADAADAADAASWAARKPVYAAFVALIERMAEVRA